MQASKLSLSVPQRSQMPRKGIQIGQPRRWALRFCTVVGFLYLGFAGGCGALTALTALPKIATAGRGLFACASGVGKVGALTKATSVAATTARGAEAVGEVSRAAKSAAVLERDAVAVGRLAQSAQGIGQGLHEASALARSVSLMREALTEPALANVAHQAIQAGVDLRDFPLLLDRYPDVAKVAGFADKVADLARQLPGFAECLGRELYLRPDLWARFRSMTQTTELVVQNAAAFREGMPMFAAERLEEVLQATARQLANMTQTLQEIEGLTDNARKQGVVLEIHDGMIWLQVHTPHFKLIAEGISVKKAVAAVVGVAAASGAAQELSRLLWFREERLQTEKI